MKHTVYNKLVRDNIPQIIRSSGKICETEILSGEAYQKMVDAKLIEELDEYLADQSLEELADLMEVILAAVAARGYSAAQLEQCRLAKREIRGGFDEKILLKNVYEP